jgi:hypothetical protein
MRRNRGKRSVMLISFFFVLEILIRPVKLDIQIQHLEDRKTGEEFEKTSNVFI